MAARAELSLEINISGKAVDRAGKVLAAEASDPAEYERALQLVNNWRASFSLPLRAVAEYLEYTGREISEAAFVSRRLKRMESIVGKLKRPDSGVLSQMQDIGGCRIVLPTLADIWNLRQKEPSFQEPPLQTVKLRDYIAHPKPDGYRSIHVIAPIQTGSLAERRGLKIETQIRSADQHAWATALEAVDLFSNQTMKVGGGDLKWKRFFALASTVFAMREGTPLVPGTYEDGGSFRKELTALWFELRVMEKMRFWSISVNQLLREGPPNEDIFLITIDLKEMRLYAIGFSKENVHAANTAYTNMEQEIRDGRNAHTVLVAVERMQYLREAYPNFFADTGAFLEAMGRYLDVPITFIPHPLLDSQK